jgi:hypothetical protein
LRQVPNGSHRTLSTDDVDIIEHGRGRAKPVRVNGELGVVDGWTVIDEQFCADHQPADDEATRKRLVSYFDGRVPSWSDVLAGWPRPELPVLETAQKIIDTLS